MFHPFSFPDVCYLSLLLGILSYACTLEFRRILREASHLLKVLADKGERYLLLHTLQFIQGLWPIKFDWWEKCGDHLQATQGFGILSSLLHWNWTYLRSTFFIRMILSNSHSVRLGLIFYLLEMPITTWCDESDDSNSKDLKSPVLQDLTKMYPLLIPSSGGAQTQGIKVCATLIWWVILAKDSDDPKRGLILAIDVSAQHWPPCYPRSINYINIT